MRRERALLGVVIGVIATAVSSGIAQDAKQIRIGLIGLDTSHVTAFTGAINGAEPGSPLAAARVVAGYPGGSPDVHASASRVEGFTNTLRERGVEIVDSIETLCGKVDAVMLESVDGRPHLEQVRPVLAAKLPVFIDKPMAGSLADVIEIFRLADAAGVPCWSSSSLRYMKGAMDLKGNDRVGEILSAVTWGPCSLEPHHPDFFWYGVHGMEVLYMLMGTGCQAVQRTHADGRDVATGLWEGGRTGTFIGLRDGKQGYGAIVFGSKAIRQAEGGSSGYRPLLLEVVKFFQTGRPPVSASETIELFAFMEAADESKRQGGATVTIESVVRRARAKYQGAGR